MADTTSDEQITPGGYVEEEVKFLPETELHYNTSDELIKIVKRTIAGNVYERQITDPDITDYDVDRIVIYSRVKQSL